MTSKAPVPDGYARRALRSVKGVLITVAAFSGMLNLLMLTGSLFMLQVYDRVLPSRSLETLVALLLLVSLIYAAQSVLEAIRSRIFARIGRHVDAELGPRVFDVQLRRLLDNNNGTAGFRDLEQLRGFLSGAGPTAIFDLPWLPIYLILLFLLHPFLGLIGLVGGMILATMTWLADRAARPTQMEASKLTNEANMMSEQAWRAGETVLPLGMARALNARWTERNLAAGATVLRGSDQAGFYGSISRFFRMALQSFMLAAGAWLIIKGSATGGVMIASSVLLGRALAPLELAITHWRGFVAARQSFARLEASLGDPDAALSERVSLPLPKATLAVNELIVTVPGAKTPLIQGATFALQAGDGLGVVGASGAGKSTLLRTVVGLMTPVRGAVRFDGSTLDQWPMDQWGEFIGYLPQQVDLFSGTVGENICRFAPGDHDAAILAAAEEAGVSQFIRSLPDGFDTQVGEGGRRLSAGQRQRVALARALFGEPFLVILDEPNSALDQEGEAALSKALMAVRARGGIVIAAVHRPSAFQAVNKIMVLNDGMIQAFGPTEEILRPAPGPPGPRPTTSPASPPSRGGGPLIIKGAN